MNKEILAKIKWQARRGMLELDLILSRFLENAGDRLSDAQWQAISLLLNEQDPDLYTWLMGYQTPEEEGLKNSVALIQAIYSAK